MAVSPAMFLFEIVVESVKSLVESQQFIMKSDFADIFSLELKDPKQLHITMPVPPPLAPEPLGKKGKKKKPKRKSKKGKKSKKDKNEELPPEPAIQSGQSVLFSSTAEFLIQTMKKCPIELALWNKEDNFTHIGSALIPWDLAFMTYLQKVYNCETPPPVKVNEEYNIFQEGTAKLIAKVGMQIKLTYLSDKLTTTFRTLSEDPTMRKILYTGINSKTTSYICTMKTTEEHFEENCNKIENNFVKDVPKSDKIVYADYRNAPGTNLTSFTESDYCCMDNVDKSLLPINKSPKMTPDIDFIIDYVRKVIISCNDHLRRLIPCPLIKPSIKATDAYKLCYCKQTNWPNSQLAEKFKSEVQSTSCPVCTIVQEKAEAALNNKFDIANLRGPCGKPDCRIARDMRAYIKQLIEEDNKEININDIVGPCGSKECTLAEKIKQILRHEGPFTEGSTLEGLSTQCACIQTLNQALDKKESCDTSCSKNCEEGDSETSDCKGTLCPFKREPIANNVYNVFYFTVEHDFDKNNSGTISPTSTDKSPKFQYCSTECTSLKTSSKTSCSKSASSIFTDKSPEKPGELSKCQDPVCTSQHDFPVSPADSDITIHFENIKNPCGVKSCNVSEKVKNIIVDGIKNKKNKMMKDEPCYCNCLCDYNFSDRTTYCSVCGGYERLGDDVKEMPEYVRPHPCPVYHKIPDKKHIKEESPWPDKIGPKKTNSQVDSNKNLRTDSKSGPLLTDNRKSTMNLNSPKKLIEKKSDKEENIIEPNKPKNIRREKKKIGKFTANIDRSPLKTVVEKRPEKKYPYPSVPKNKGWNWSAESIPGMKPRPHWRPGAVKKVFVRRYKSGRKGVDIIAKKKRAMMQKKKKMEMKPTLVVTKQNGEYKVQMEVFKTYSKERLPFQYPYDEKPPLVYTIGKTEEEKRKIQKQQERKERRETRRKNRLLQSTFRDRCQDICLKAYNQAIGALPLPNPNDPECPCQTAAVPNVSPSDSCSCSDEEDILSSDTDGDEWVVKFTPPVARWNTKSKHPPVVTDNESQYNYLDYKVKLLDKSGNPVPRYFKGPDGKQECSDLGGFWGPGHIWLEINKDGYIGPDNRWVPINFFGPDGKSYSAEEGGFTDNTGRYLKIGVDGYIDKDRKWAWYSKNRSLKSLNSKSVFNTRVTLQKYNKRNIDKSEKDKHEIKNTYFANSRKANEDKKHLKEIFPKAFNYKDKVKKSVSYSSAIGNTPLIKSASINYEKHKSPQFGNKTSTNSKKINKYKEIMKELEMHDDLSEYKPLTKINRASNTRKKT